MTIHARIDGLQSVQAKIRGRIDGTQRVFGNPARARIDGLQGVADLIVRARIDGTQRILGDPVRARIDGAATVRTFTGSGIRRTLRMQRLIR